MERPARISASDWRSISLETDVQPHVQDEAVVDRSKIELEHGHAHARVIKTGCLARESSFSIEMRLFSRVSTYTSCPRRASSSAQRQPTFGSQPLLGSHA